MEPQKSLPPAQRAPVKDTTSLFTHSEFSWVENLAPGRNQFVSFKRKFYLSSPKPATLHLFADTRYRLWVNGTFAAYGPGRFVTPHPEYDSLDLSPFLQRGENILRVEVNYYGSSSFQTMPDGLPGFIAAGGTEDKSEDFATPGAWLAHVHKAWDPKAPLFSFAQNPAEICDTRILTAELASFANLPTAKLPAQARPWPKPTPRSAPYPDYAPVRPARLLVTGPAQNRALWGIQITRPDNFEMESHHNNPFLVFSTWIHSSRDQQATLDCFWTHLELNGHPLTISYSGKLGNHGQASITLRTGWNFLAGNFTVMLEHWPYLLGFPLEANVSLHALPHLSCSETFAVSSFVKAPGIPAFPGSPEAYRLPFGWKLFASDLSRITPARLTGWDTPDSATTQMDLPRKLFSSVITHTARSAIWVYDFADEYYGHPTIEVEAPAGSILDIAYDDWKRADGCVNLYASNPFTDAADRFTLTGGRQRIEVLNPRGGIYLQIVLRVPAGSSPAALSVHDVAIRNRTTIGNINGSFYCGDPIIDWSWKTSVHTLKASTDEAYSDCPWRERGSYIGDSLVNLHLHRLISSDLSIARRTFDLMGKAQLPNGQLPCCAPSWLTRPHEDFTLIWIQAVRDYWAYTGETDFVAAQWPVIQRIWNSPTWKPDAHGLWDMTGMRVFLDWGVLPSEREGPGNSAVNILRIAALRATAELAQALGFKEEANHRTAAANQITEALTVHLWNYKEGRFHASVGGESPAIHANILALRYGIGPGEKILAYLEPRLRNNFINGREHGQFSGFAELYFFYYLLPALASHDRHDLAESLIRDHYGFLKSLNYPTLPEHFHQADSGQGSCCHSWSGAPALYSTEYILGLRLAEGGNPNNFILNPVSSSFNHAQGCLPHPKGIIEVEWTRKGKCIHAKATLPQGVNLNSAPNVNLTFELKHRHLPASSPKKGLSQPSCV